MGRPERPLDPEAGLVQQFAFDLRRLREQSGRLSYQELAKRAHYAANTLSEAAKGEKLPTLEVARAFVKACGGDEDAWEARWREVHDQQAQEQADSGLSAAVAATPRVPAAEAATVADPPEAHSSRGRPQAPWLAAASVAFMLVVVSGGILWGNQRSPAATDSPPLVPLHLLRAVHDDGLMRIWTVTTDSAQAVQLMSTARYQMKDELGDCYTKQEPGTVPVWHHTYKFKADGYDQHLYTIEKDPRQDQALIWGWTASDPQPVCYVYRTPMPDTKPIYRMREGSVGPTNGAGDGHGHVLTLSQAQYQPYGFVTDQVWYVPMGAGPGRGQALSRTAH